MVIAAVDPNKKDLKQLVRCLYTVCPSCEVMMFCDSKAAAEHLRETPIDVLFVEPAMLNINGFKLKAMTEKVQPALKTVFVSSTDEYALEAMKVKAQDYIVKPVTAETVKNILKEII